MIKVERSGYVKAQLTALEAHVLSLRQRYDSLTTSRHQREHSLYLSTQVLSSLLQERACPRTHSRLFSTQALLSDAEEKLDRELMYRETLEHMLESARRGILAKTGPMQPMIRSLTKDRIKNKAENSTAVVTAYEVERLRSEMKLLQRQFATQHSQHSTAIHTLFERYSMQKEFALLCAEQQKQFSLRDSINELDLEERKTMALLREAKSAEEMKRKSDILNEQAQKQKEALSQLSQVARLTDADDIIQYYNFLVESSHTLEATRLSLEERISTLKDTLDLTTLEFKQVSDTTSEIIPNFTHINALEEAVRTAEKVEEARLEKVNLFQKEYGGVQEMIAGLVAQIGDPPKSIESDDVPILLLFLESYLVQILSDLDLKTHRTEATESSYIA